MNNTTIEEELEKEAEKYIKDIQCTNSSVSIQNSIKGFSYDAFCEGAKSNIAKKIHQKDMYSKKQVEILLKSLFTYSFDRPLEELSIDKWIEQNLK